MNIAPSAASPVDRRQSVPNESWAADSAATDPPQDPRLSTRVAVLLSAGLALSSASVLSLQYGSVAVSGAEVWAALFGPSLSVVSVASGESIGATIVWTLRFPRLVLGMLIGCSLALAGIF